MGHVKTHKWESHRMLNIMQNKIVGVNNELDSPEILVKKESLGSKNKNFEINLQTSPKR